MKYRSTRDNNIIKDDKIALLQKQIHEEEGLIVVYGVGAGLIHTGDLSVYGSMSYQTIKNRFMDGIGLNGLVTN